MSAERASSGRKVPGPLRATIPICSVLKPQNCGSVLFGQRSPGAPTSFVNTGSTIGSFGSVGASRGTFKLDKDGPCKMRRTASLDTIYLKGHWPRDSFHCYSGILQVNKATQTDDCDLDQQRSTKLMNSISECALDSTSTSSSSKDSKDKMASCRPKMRTANHSGPSSRHGSPDTLNTSSQTLTSTILNYPSSSCSAARHSMRSSIEGLNQEIERIVLQKATNTDSIEGHRAPPPQLFRSRSVNTQTPNEEEEEEDEEMDRTSARLFMDSPIQSGSSTTSSPDQADSKQLGTSPHINRFLAREPPDGCEKVLTSKMEQQQSRLGQSGGPFCPHDVTSSSVATAASAFRLRPSLGSAFNTVGNTAQQQDLS